LKRLSGRTHKVLTGVSVIRGGETETFYETTLVDMYDNSDEELLAYIATGEPMDKAGAYGIQGRGMLLIKKINGDYYNVMGLPIARLYRILGKDR
ncbi:MAG: Maf family protein, partial [Lachnospiraceae bacterium]|nr:Maf family protein [Lachnospiraceae bacterium]